MPFAVRTRTTHRVQRKRSQASSAFARAHGAPYIATDWGWRYDLAVFTMSPTRTEVTGRSVRTAPEIGRDLIGPRARGGRPRLPGVLEEGMTLRRGAYQGDAR